jgi:hypothetical protein
VLPICKSKDQKLGLMEMTYECVKDGHSALAKVDNRIEDQRRMFVQEAAQSKIPYVGFKKELGVKLELADEITDIK